MEQIVKICVDLSDDARTNSTSFVSQRDHNSALITRGGGLERKPCFLQASDDFTYMRRADLNRLGKIGGTGRTAVNELIEDEK